MLYIHHRSTGTEAFAITGRKGITITVKLVIPFFFSRLLNKCIMQIVLPGTGNLPDFSGNGLFIKDHRVIGIKTQGVLRSGQNGFRKIGIKFNIQR